MNGLLRGIFEKKCTRRKQFFCRDKPENDIYYRGKTVLTPFLLQCIVKGDSINDIPIGWIEKGRVMIVWIKTNEKQIAIKGIDKLNKTEERKEFPGRGRKEFEGWNESKKKKRKKGLEKNPNYESKKKYFFNMCHVGLTTCALTNERIK